VGWEEVWFFGPNGLAELRPSEFILGFLSLSVTLIPMTWKTLIDLLANEFRRLRGIHVVNFGFANQPILSVAELHEEERVCAARVDAMIKDFARTGRWPLLDEKARFFLRERLRFAYEYSVIAEITAHRPISLATRPNVLNEQRRLLEWLLIDVWKNSGLINWLEPLILLERSTMARDSLDGELHICA
jgi:hypothetical protein